jgi:hypothetical protein
MNLGICCDARASEHQYHHGDAHNQLLFATDVGCPWLTDSFDQPMHAHIFAERACLDKQCHEAFTNKLKIRVSVVRFRPWPPILSRSIPVTSLTPYSGRIVNNIAKRAVADYNRAAIHGMTRFSVAAMTGNAHA